MKHVILGFSFAIAYSEGIRDHVNNAGIKKATYVKKAMMLRRQNCKNKKKKNTNAITMW